MYGMDEKKRQFFLDSLILYILLGGRINLFYKIYTYDNNYKIYVQYHILLPPL